MHVKYTLCENIRINILNDHDLSKPNYFLNPKPKSKVIENTKIIFNGSFWRNWLVKN